MLSETTFQSSLQLSNGDGLLCRRSGEKQSFDGCRTLFGVLESVCFMDCLSDQSHLHFTVSHQVVIRKNWPGMELFQFSEAQLNATAPAAFLAVGRGNFSTSIWFPLK